MNTSIDYLIVGQGLAGTLIAWNLERRGKRVHLIDPAHAHAASKVAAGLINPITGRRMVKTWLIDALLPKARATYAALETQLEVQLVHPRPILRALLDPNAINLWGDRSYDPLFEAYAKKKADLGSYQRLLPKVAFGETAQSLQIDLALLITAYRKYCLEKQQIWTESMDYSALEILPQGIRYKDLQAGAVIFCEGYRGKENPYFGPRMPYRGAKGEVLIVQFPDHQFEKILKHQCFVAPLGKEQYWIGSNYDRYYADDKPTAEGRTYFQNLLTKILNIPFEVEAHRAAIRPTIKDRRPLLGRHWQHAQLILFNGLGTKGASLGPYFAEALTNHLLNQTPLPQEVDLNRFL